METKNLNDYLNQFFQDVVLNGLTEENSQNIEVFLSQVVDTNENSIFNNILLYNFLNLLKNLEISTFIINHLIKEVELKGLRLYYRSLLYPSLNPPKTAQSQNQNKNNGCYNGSSQQQQNRQNQKNTDILSIEGQLRNFNDTPLSEVLEKTEKAEIGNKK